MGNSGTDRQRRSYEFFCEMERQKKQFSLYEVAEATGWSPQTVRTYAAKKWDKFLKKNAGVYCVEGVTRYSEAQYCRMMSQADRLSTEPYKPDLPLEVERLVVKAREAALLALDIYNRPATIFRTEGFLVMMVIAWTALLHAIFERDHKRYLYYNRDGSPVMTEDGDQKAWELRKCISEFFGAETTAVRKNLEFCLGLRNKVEHRYVPAIDPHVVGECQALLTNFDDLLVREFGDYWALRECLSVPLQTTTLRTASQADTMRKFQGKQYDELKDYIDSFRFGLPREIVEDQRFRFRVYLVPVVGNHESSSDLAIEFLKEDEARAVNKQIVAIREKKCQVANQGKFKPSSVADRVSKAIGRPFSVHNHTQAWKMYRVRQSGEDPRGCRVEYCQFDDAHRDYVYTQKWVDFLIEKLANEEEYRRVTSYKWWKQQQ